MSRIRVTPPQDGALKKDNPAHDALVSDARLAMEIGEIWLEPVHLRIAQPAWIAHVTAPFWKR